MKMLMGFFGAMTFLGAAAGALGDVPCKKCTHDMEVQYRECLQSGRAQAICAKEEQEAAQKCVAICNAKQPPPGDSAGVTRDSTLTADQLQPDVAAGGTAQP
jgi:hypothetical protein